MSFVTWRGTTPTNTIQEAHIVLSAFSITDELVLSAFLELQNAYQIEEDEHPVADGRSIERSLRLKGLASGQYPRRWSCSFLAKPPMAALFDRLLDAQPANQVVISDYWEGAPVLNIPVFILIKSGYIRPIGADWKLLSFELLEVV
jgi:hypothetical protein